MKPFNVFAGAPSAMQFAAQDAFNAGDEERVREIGAEFDKWTIDERVAKANAKLAGELRKEAVGAGKTAASQKRSDRNAAVNDLEGLQKELRFR